MSLTVCHCRRTQQRGATSAPAPTEPHAALRAGVKRTRAQVQREGDSPRSCAGDAAARAAADVGTLKHYFRAR